jgi:prolyl oligopeptidase
MMPNLVLVILATSLGAVEDNHPVEDKSNPPVTAGERASGTPPIVYPTTRRDDQTDTFHGVQVADPYRWLETDVRQSDDVQAWVERQNAVTESYLASIPERELIRRRLTKLWNYPRYSAPSQVGGKYFFQKNDGLQNQAVLYVIDALDATPQLLLDPNAWSEDGTVALSAAVPSHDGMKLAYTVSEAGSDWKTLKILDLASGQTKADELKWLRWGGVEWTRSGDGFYYGRYPEPEAGEQYQSLALNHMIYFHKLGTRQEQDQLIYRRPDQPEWTFSITPTHDEHYLVLEISKSTDDQNQVWFRRTTDSEWTEVIGDFDNQFGFVGSQDSTFYFFTDLDAPTKRIVALNMDRLSGAATARNSLQEIVPAAAEAMQSASVVNQQLIATYLKDALTQVRIFSLDGQAVRDVEFPGPGTANGFDGEQDDTETFYSFSSYTTPSSIYHYDLTTGTSTQWHQSEVEFDAERFESHQVFYTSHDGTRIPMMLAHRKGLERNGNQPTLLYGYGGFNISLTPQFAVSYVAWMEMGGMVAVPNLRGGGEYGEPWHLAGKLEHKQNVFDDFVAAAEWLIAENYTRPARIAIQGRSNGGLLVGAVMTQRPQLFGACLPGVGVMDMLRYHQFTAGRFWVDEYGTVDNADQFAALLKYSPYHNLRPGTEFPPTLVSTADTDDRVVPMHSFKFAAALQHAQCGPAPVLIRIETRAGHGAGTPTSKLIDNVTDHWAFLVRSLDFELPPDFGDELTTDSSNDAKAGR